MLFSYSKLARPHISMSLSSVKLYFEHKQELQIQNFSYALFFLEILYVMPCNIHEYLCTDGPTVKSSLDASRSTSPPIPVMSHTL